MKIKKYYTYFWMITLLSVSLIISGCSAKAPEDAVKEELDLLIAPDQETLKEIILPESILDELLEGLESDDDLSAAYEEFMQKFFKNFSYEITNSKIDGTSAAVDVTIFNYDMKSYAKDCYIEFYKKLIEENLLEAEQKEWMLLYFEILTDTLQNEYEITSSSGVITLKKENGQWNIDESQELGDLLLSGFISYRSDPYLLTGQEYIEMIFESIAGLDTNTLISFLDLEDLEDSESGVTQDTIEVLASQILALFDYTILSSEDSGDTSVVTAEVTCLDFNTILENFYADVLEFAATDKAAEMNEDELDEYLEDLLYNHFLSQAISATNEVVIELYNDGSSWEYTNENIIFQCLLGTDLSE